MLWFCYTCDGMRLVDFSAVNHSRTKKTREYAVIIRIARNPMQKSTRNMMLDHLKTSFTVLYRGEMASTANTTCIAPMMTEKRANNPMKKCGQLMGRRGSGIV